MTDSSTIVLVEKPADPVGGRSLRFLIAIVGVIGLAASLTFPFPMDARHWGALFDLAHAPAFFLVYLLIAGILDPDAIRFSRRLTPIVSLTIRKLVLLGVILCVVGIVGELAQGLVSRSPSLLDVVANCSGLLAAMFWCAGGRSQKFHQRWALVIIASALVIIPEISPILELRECILQRKEFPLLASFERSQELNAWFPHRARASITSEWASQGTQSMRIQGKTITNFPGATMIWPVNDWSEYARLQLDVYNPQDMDLTVGINICDRYHAATRHNPADRYQKSFVVAGLSTQTITIELSDVASAPVARDMKMTKVAMLDIFMPESTVETTLFVDWIRLTK